MTWRVVLYYLPEGYETVMTFNNPAIEDGAVIYTNNDEFLVDGSVFTMAGFVQLYVNGNHVVAYKSNGVDVTGEGRTVGFSHSVKLEEGENKLLVEMYDATMDEIETVAFTVILDKTAPETPEITADDEGNITITSDEDDVTLYYSLDGEVWTVYTDTFPMTADGTVYAKAVDAAGNESEVASLNITLPAPTAPGITVDDEGNVTITSTDDDAELYYSYDGETWTKYEGTFAAEHDGTVYAKAVGANGKESDISKIDVTLPVPSTPAITTDGEGNVTVTGDEDSTLYYSLDGETWVEYTGPFTLTESGTVYVKAVGSNGKESEVASLYVTVPDPTPVTPPPATGDTTDDTDDTDKPTPPPKTGDDSGTFNALNVVMITLSLAAIAWVVFDMVHAHVRKSK